ncbi:hypothetical protein Tco_0790324 [Tanacetum coccineum]
MSLKKIEEEPEKEPVEDVDIEIEDDAELIFPYEAEGDKTPPPRDVSSDYVSSDSESEDEEVDVVPEATVGTYYQKPYVFATLPRGLLRLKSQFLLETHSHFDGRDKVKFATATLQGRALTWWNGRIASMGIDAANGTPWTKVRKWMTEEFCPQSVLQRLEQELIVEPEQVKVEQYIRGLLKNIRGDVTSSRPAGIDEVARMAYQLMGQIIQDKTDEVSEGEKRKGEGDCGGCGDNRCDYNRRQNQRRANAGAMTNVSPNDNEVCPKCKNKFLNL